MKTVFITGAGRGLGKAIAQAYHQAGFAVVATDINAWMLEDFKNEEGYIPMPVDVSSENEVQKAAEKIKQVDVVVSNAGVFDFYPVSEAGSTKLKKMFDVNVFGLTNLTKYFLPHLTESKGRLIVISSESYKVPSPFQPYSVSKQALEKVFDSIKIELQTRGVRSILIRPGAMNTKIIDDTLGFDPEINDSLYRKEFSAFIKAIPRYINKIVNPETVASKVLEAGTSNKPKNVYHINQNPAVSILSVLPAKFKKYLVQKSLK